jgi:hypothetical protein
MATRALQQVVCYTAWNTSTNVYVTGDVAQHALSWSKDGTRSAATNAAAEVDATNMPGLYKVVMTATETDCIQGVLGGKSSTANVVLIPTMVSFDYLNTAAPATAGVPDVNVKNMNNVAATSITTINANQGTTQPVNFTGTAGTALVKADAVDIAGAAVSTSTAQIGVNVVTNGDKTGYALATGQKVDVDTIKTNPVVNAGTVTFPTGATLASTTNITAGTITTTTNLTNLPAIPNNWITAAGITAAALNGKGDWLLASGYTAPPTTAQIATGVWTDTTAGDFTTALSVGKSVMNGVTLGTGLTVNALTTNNDKTGYSLAAGQKVDVDTIKTNPVVNAGTVTFPTGATLASTTNITAGTITTTTNLTNAATAGDLTTAMKTSVENAVWDATLASHANVGSTGAALASASSAGDPWNTPIPGAYVGGTAGHRLGNIPDVTAGAAGGVFIAGSNAATTVNFTGNLSGSVGSVSGAVNSVTTGVTVTTNNDKTGYSLTQTFPTNFSALSITAAGRAAITSNTPKNAAGRITFVMTDATTHAPKTGLTVASTVSIDGAAFGATVNSPTAVGNGAYTLVLAAGDTNGNDLMFRFTAAGADDLNLEYVTQP